MSSNDLGELDIVRNECKSMVTKRALLSAGASIIPVPGVDILADLSMLTDVLPKISSKFNLAPEQIEQLDPKSKALIYSAATGLGTQMVGKVLTKQLILQVLKTVGLKIPARQVAKFVPIFGQAASATMGFIAMKFVCESHINDCYRVAEQVAASKR